jgi:rhodanese-related sulfurtransferase
MRIDMRLRRRRAKRKMDYENVPPEIAAQMIKDGECYVIDVRTPEEFVAHRIAGAYLLPVQELQQRHPEIPRAPKKKILIYCEHGVRSVGTCRALAENGWSSLLNMSGGMAEWIERGLPYVSGTNFEDAKLKPE